LRLLETKQAPNARRVRIFLAEKGITLDTLELDLKNGDNLTPEFKDKNPFAKVPVLELDDGSYISESVAICRYFEETHPEPPLLGSDPLQKAQIEMWQRRAEFGFLYPIAMGFQHCSGFFKDRMTPREDWGKDCVKSAHKYLNMIETHLAKNEFLTGEQFSIADITMLITLDFSRVVDVRLNEEHPNLKRWYEQVSSRESAKA
jgi:glutathione S-transferase